MYCTVDEVKAAINFPSTGAPVSDADITDFILDSEEEIERLYNTKFGNVEASGTADGDFSTTTFSDSTQSWTTDEHVGDVVWIHTGTGSGQYREITVNDATKVTVSPAFDTTPDATSEYRIVMLGYEDEDVDGSGNDEQFTRHLPLINLNALTIDTDSITVGNVFTYNDSGRLVLGPDAEASYFLRTQPQQINIKYIYGVYPIPRIIKRLCVILAGMRTVAAKISGSYTDFATISLPGGVSGSKGQPYVNLQAGITQMSNEAKKIVEMTYAPFTLFG